MAYKTSVIPCNNASFVPDLPTSALAPNEYTDGLNVEADIRGIRSVLGDQQTLPKLPVGYIPTFITSSQRPDGYAFIVAAYATIGTATYGKWFMSTVGNSLTDQKTAVWVDITPDSLNDGDAYSGYIKGYSQDTNITASWNGFTLFVNDTISPPMFLLPNSTQLVKYSRKLDVNGWYVSQVQTPVGQPPQYKVKTYIAGNGVITGSTITTGSGSDSLQVGMVLQGTGVITGTTVTRVITATTYEINKTYTSSVTVSNLFSDSYDRPANYRPYSKGEYITLTFLGADVIGQVVSYNIFSPVFTVVSGDVTPMLAAQLPVKVSSTYVWDYVPETITAQFLRLYNSPNVGSILVYGGLTGKTISNTGVVTATSNYLNVVGWSQAFGVDGIPKSFEPTLLNVANQVSIPIKGPIIDGFTNNGNFYVASYWDMAIMTPRNYTSTLAPILAIRPMNVTRGIFSSNCITQTDTTVYGLDSRDVWEFDGQNFRSIGDQAVKNYVTNNIGVPFTNRIFMEHNSSKYQIEIYYPSSSSVDGVPDRMISYRYDLKVWNAPREVYRATFTTESPVVYASQGIYSTLPATRVVTYASAIDASSTVQSQFWHKDVAYIFPITATNPNGAIRSYFNKQGILFGQLNQENSVHRIYPRMTAIGGNVSSAGNSTRNEPIVLTNKFVYIYLDGAGTSTGFYTTISIDKYNLLDKYIQPIKMNYTVHGIQISAVSDFYTNLAWHCADLTVFYTTNTQQE